MMYDVTISSSDGTIRHSRPDHAPPLAANRTTLIDQKPHRCVDDSNPRTSRTAPQVAVSSSSWSSGNGDHLDTYPRLIPTAVKCNTSERYGRSFVLTLTLFDHEIMGVLDDDGTGLFLLCGQLCLTVMVRA